MDRNKPHFNRYLAEKWQSESHIQHRSRIEKIQTKPHSSQYRRDNKKYAAQKNIYHAHSRKHALAAEKKSEIDKRNQELY